jgi:hypothetical protein
MLPRFRIFFEDFLGSFAEEVLQSQWSLEFQTIPLRQNDFVLKVLDQQRINSLYTSLGNIKHPVV